MRLTPDGARYMALSTGRRAPRPFHLRWFLPIACRQSIIRWRVTAWASWAALAVGTGFLASDWKRAVAAGLLIAALPSSRFNLRNPVLVDSTSMAFAVWAAVCVQEGLWPLGLVLILVSGMVKETGPVFGALYAWAPVLLVGLVAPAVRALLAKPGPDVLDAENAWILAHPFRAGQKYHYWLDPIMVVPWGGAIVGLAALDWQLAACLAVAYAQLLVATDTVRLYQWAAPLLCVAACVAVPTAWLPVLVVVTVWNPYAGSGV